MKFVTFTAFSSLTIALLLASLQRSAVAQMDPSYADRLPPSPSAEGYRPSLSEGMSQEVNGTAYRVLIPSDNPTLLAQAQSIEPTAFLQSINGQRVIQVGLYSNATIAQQQVSRFQAQGMPVRIEPAAVTFIQPTAMQSQPSALSMESPSNLSPMNPLPQPSLLSAPSNLPPSQPAPLSRQPKATAGYYVIIPVSQQQTARVQNFLVQLGIPAQYILLRDRPFGLHYAIGIYSQRGTAEKLASLIQSRSSSQSERFDARVHFER